MEGFVPWRVAMEAALYGPDGFFHQPAGPAAHFRTSAHVSLFAGAVLELLCRVDAALGHPDPIDFVDVGAGRGELIGAVADAAPSGLARRLRLTAVELAEGPEDSRVTWTDTIPPCTGLIFANEWLDNIPLDVAEIAPDGVTRQVLVDPSTGDETLGEPVNTAWLDRWWAVKHRAEIGSTRDDAWAAAVARLVQGATVAVDYGHLADSRPDGGTLTGYAAGRQVPPIPDGSCDLTAHVAVDAVAAAGVEAGAEATRITSQRDALHALGLTGARPPRELASSDPVGYLRALSVAGEAAELLDPAGLGGFYWLVQAVGIELDSVIP